MKKILKNILIIVILLLIICMIGIIIYKTRPIPKAQSRINSFNNLTKYKDSDSIVILNNTQEWSKNYKGEVSVAAVNTIINYFAKELIPEYRKIDNVEGYYESNKEIIQIFTGIDNLEDFKEIVEKAKILKGENLHLERAEYLKNTSRIVGKNAYSILALQYSGNDKVLFNVIIDGYIEEGITSVRFNAKVDEDEYDVTRQEIIVNKSNPSNHTGKVIK